MRRINRAVIGAATVGIISASSFGVIRHPNAWETSSPTDPVGPSTSWFARYANNATAIAIGPNTLLTTIHQGWGPGSATIVFPSGPNAGSYVETSETLIGTNVDLRVVYVNATFSTWAPLYTDTTTSIIGQTAIFGGFGATRGTTTLTSGGAIVGYTVANGSPNQNSGALIFGQQRIDGLGMYPDTVPANIVNTPELLSDFDGPDSAPLAASPLPTDKVPYEASFGLGDSGGGWFINDAGTWKLTGLSEYNNNLGMFGSNTIGFGLEMGAVDIRSFTPTIASIVPEPSILGLIALGTLPLLRRRR